MCTICSVYLIRVLSEQLLARKNTMQPQLDMHPRTLDDLDELGEIMTEMLHRQETVEVSMLCDTAGDIVSNICSSIPKNI